LIDSELAIDGLLIDEYADCIVHTEQSSQTMFLQDYINSHKTVESSSAYAIFHRPEAVSNTSINLGNRQGVMN